MSLIGLEDGVRVPHESDNTEFKGPTNMPFRIEITRDEKVSVKKTWEPPLPYGPDSLTSHISFGIPLTEELIQALRDHHLLIQPHREDIADIMGWNGGPFFVTGKIQDIIEDLEPGIHHFYDVTTVMENTGEPTGKSYKLLHVTQAIDAVDLERSDTMPSRDKKRTLLRSGSAARCALKSEKLGGQHLWRGTESLYSYYFCSDQFAEAIRNSGCEGWEFDPCELVNGNS